MDSVDSCRRECKLCGIVLEGMETAWKYFGGDRDPFVACLRP
jgi:hypothetical protein